LPNRFAKPAVNCCKNTAIYSRKNLKPLSIAQIGIIKKYGTLNFLFQKDRTSIFLRESLNLSEQFIYLLE